MYAITANSIEIVRDGITFKFDKCEPSEFAKDVAKRELRETPENVENGLKELRKLLQEEPNLHCPLDNDLWLLSFLRPAHFYPESARNMIQKFFNYRTKYPDLCKHITLESVRDVLQDFTGSLLPRRCPNGSRLFTVLSGKYWNPSKYTNDMILRGFIAQAEYVRSEPDTQICGVTVIADMEDLTLSQALRFTPAFSKRLVDYIQDGMCLRLKGYHVVNQPKLFNMILTLARPFISEKFFKRLHIHGKDMESLHRHIPPEYLPKCYGGTGPNTRQSYGTEFFELMTKYEVEYDKAMTYGYRN